MILGGSASITVASMTLPAKTAIQYPMFAMLDYISDSYSSLDLCSGYWQVELTLEVCSKTAFFIGQGL